MQRQEAEVNLMWMTERAQALEEQINKRAVEHARKLGRLRVTASEYPRFFQLCNEKLRII